MITQRQPLHDLPEPIEGLINGPFAVGSNPQVARLVVHLVNFPDFIGSPIEVGARHYIAGRALLSGSGWRFTIDGLPNTRRLFDSIRITGGYAITHVGVLEREDGTPFRPSEADDHLLGIGTFLSFAAGAWAFPQLHVGLAADGSPVYRECGVRPVHPWGGRFRWFNDHDGASLERAFVSFDQLWARGEWREPLQKLIYLYVEANDRPPDVGLVLAQAALEQMAWHLLVNDRRVLSRGGFAKLSAADQLRRLVKTCVIPLDTPSALKHLAGVKTPGSQHADGPYWIARLRNDFVHPPREGQSARTSGRIVDAWLLSVWYLELALLSLMGYSGEYRSRLNSGEVSRLPWS